MAIATLLALAVSCGADIESGKELAGQRCFATSDCVSGLVCYNRTCVPPSGTVPGDPDASNNQNNVNNANNVNNVNNVNNLNNVNNINNVNNGVCMPGDQRCSDSGTLLICIESPDGTGTYVEEVCPRGTFCVNGTCIRENQCIDNDGDGYGDGCERGPDCNDRNPSINPGARENCNTPNDDNCSGQANEGCMNTCCPGGCADDQFCDVNCMCSDFQPGVCQFQNQPCAQEGQASNGFFCSSIDGQSQPRCYGVCDRTAPDPNATCPEPNSVCSFGEGGDQGICLSACDPASGCGSADQGCVPSDGSPSGGVCLPANPGNPIGGMCNADNTLDCEAGAICVPNRFGGGICREVCRPFEYVNQPGNQTDCSTGHCLAFGPGLGICSQDNNSMEGARCMAQNTACGADAVGCYPSFQGGNRCQRLCRLDQGGADCITGGTCRQFSMDQTELGVCVTP